MPYCRMIQAHHLRFKAPAWPIMLVSITPALDKACQPPTAPMPRVCPPQSMVSLRTSLGSKLTHMAGCPLHFQRHGMCRPACLVGQVGTMPRTALLAYIGSSSSSLLRTQLAPTALHLAMSALVCVTNAISLGTLPEIALVRVLRPSSSRMGAALHQEHMVGRPTLGLRITEVSIFRIQCS